MFMVGCGLVILRVGRMSSDVYGGMWTCDFAGGADE